MLHLLNYTYVSENQWKGNWHRSGIRQVKKWCDLVGSGRSLFCLFGCPDLLSVLHVMYVYSFFCFLSRHIWLRYVVQCYAVVHGDGVTCWKDFLNFVWSQPVWGEEVHRKIVLLPGCLWIYAGDWWVHSYTVGPFLWHLYWQASFNPEMLMGVNLFLLLYNCIAMLPKLMWQRKQGIVENGLGKGCVW